MEGGRRRTGIRKGVPPGSVWESRMKLDEMNGGIKVFSDKEAGEDGNSEFLLRPKQASGPHERRKRWQPDADKLPFQLRKTRSDILRSSDEDGIITRALSDADGMRSSKVVIDAGDVEEDKEDEEDDFKEVEEEEIKRVDVKEIDLSGKKPTNVAEEEKPLPLPPIRKKPIWSNVEKKPPPKLEHPSVDSELSKPRSSTEEEKPLPLPPIRKKPIWSNVEKKPPPKLEYPSVDSELSKPRSNPVADEAFASISETESRLQNFVHLIMWRDISKSALVFGFGSFMLISSSYAKELNFSFTSAVSYFGLIYLAVRFLYKSFLLRDVTDIKEANHRFVSEDEAIRMVKIVLPYFNELLFQLRSYFSGDPATTMKLAVVLFVLARCGSSITMWTMARFVFFGVFTLPKMHQAYSSQMTAYGRFCIRRFQDAWESCTYKKGAAVAIFTVVWNLSSLVARIWAVFMLVVAIKLYQQSLLRDADWNKAAAAAAAAAAVVDGDSAGGQSQNRGQEGRPTIGTEKKAS